MGSSRRRTSSLQDNEPVSALWIGESAIPDEAWVATPDRHTDVDERVMTGTMTWLGAGCSEGRAKEAERPCRRERAGEESEPA